MSEIITRGNFLKGGIATILASGVAPSILMADSRSAGSIGGLLGSANGGVGRGMMRNVGARNAAMFPWTNPYVTDGLAAMWDGEWNAGGGKHDSSASKIIELISGRDFLIAGAATWGDKFLYSDSEIYAKYLDLASIFINGGFTIEIVLECASTLSSSRVYVFTPVTIWNNGNYYLISGGTICNKQLTVWTASWLNESFGSYSISFGLSGSNGYKNNGSNYSGSVVFKYPSISSTDTFYIVKREAYSSAYKFYNARLYNRVLTASERASNYAIDKARFNIP